LDARALHQRSLVADTHNDLLYGVVGVAHVGLGPDFVKEVLADATPPGCEPTSGAGVTAAYIPGLAGPAGLPLVTEALLARGWSEPDIRAVLGENVRALFATELGRKR
jgi:membrane dipeptidase